MDASSNASGDRMELNGSLPFQNGTPTETLPVAWGIVFLVSVLLVCVGNALLIQRIQQTLKNTFIVSVSVSISCLSACIAIVIVLPTSLALLDVHWWSDKTLCTIQGLVSFATMTGHGLTSLLSVVGVRYKMATRAKKYFCTWWMVGIFIISGILSFLPFLDDDTYVFEASLSMCTVPSPTVFAITCSIQITVLIAVCTSIQRNAKSKSTIDIESDGQIPTVSGVVDGISRTPGYGEERLARNVLLYSFVTSFFILVALAFAITSVIWQNKWSGLLCIFFTVIACIIQPSILFSRSTSLRQTTNSVVPLPADFTCITQNIQPRIDIDQTFEMPIFRRRSTSTTVHFQSKVSDNDMRIRSVSTTCTSSGTKFSRDSRIFRTKCADSMSSNKTRVSVKSSRSTQSKTSSISIHVSSGPDSMPSWTQCTISSIDTPTSDIFRCSLKRYRKVEPTKFRRIVSEADMTKYIPNSF